MAENKYDLLLGPKRDSNLRIQHQPWYKERLISKYKYDRKPALDTTSWVFLKDGLDDFRDGKPLIHTSLLKGKRDIVLPPVNPAEASVTSSGKTKNKKDQSKIRSFTKQEAIYSKTIPNQEKRRQKVEDIEYSLLSHPLALHNEIGESLPPDVFEDICGILDPILCMSDKQPVVAPETKTQDLKIEKVESAANSELGCEFKPPSSESLSREPISGYNKAVRNIFATTEQIRAEEEANKKEEQSRLDRRKTLMVQCMRSERRKTLQNITPTATLSKIDNVTKEFCEWVKSFGGVTNNIEEDAIKTLFASEADNPTLKNPVQVLELGNVPPELRDKRNTLMDAVETSEVQDEILAVPKTNNKIKYGAWYLHPHSWKVRPANEKLKDPKELDKLKMSYMTQKTKLLEEELSETHGAQSFKQFVVQRGFERRPDFLDSVNDSDEEKPDHGRKSPSSKAHSLNLKA